MFFWSDEGKFNSLESQLKCNFLFGFLVLAVLLGNEPEEPVAEQECQDGQRQQQTQRFEHVQLVPEQTEQAEDASEAHEETNSAQVKREVGAVDAQFRPQGK